MFAKYSKHVLEGMEMVAKIDLLQVVNHGEEIRCDLIQFVVGRRNPNHR